MDAERPAGQILHGYGNALQEKILDFAASGEGETPRAGHVVGPADVDETGHEEGAQDEEIASGEPRGALAGI